MSRYAFDLSWGAMPLPGGGARFRLWAPAQPSLSLVAAGTNAQQAMNPRGDGWFDLDTDLVGIGEGYGFKLSDGTVVPDPAARAQIGDVHGPSRLVDPRAHAWKTADWKGRPWETAVIYELHTGTFTPEGTFDGVKRRLDHLATVGVTAIELMPVAQFGGDRGWGYDGVLLYAPHRAYGGPEGLKQLIDAMHERGLMALLDVVYNHFGPDGNYLSLYAPEFFHPERHTPWGAAIAYEKAPVRDFFIENAMFWLEEYRFDGLRLDAIDQIEDQSETPILDRLALAVRERITDRHIHLTTEDDRNIVHLHERDDAGRPKLFTAEWNDDYHHVAHTIGTGESDGYYGDYAADAADHMLRALMEGYVYQGQPSPYRDGAPRGEPCLMLPPTAFVNFLQNHDQVGNRAFGERLTTLASAPMVEVLTATLLLSPQIPLLYMGEEWGETRPFLYFTDFGGELGRLVREGRRNEFRKWPQFSDPELREQIPDPDAPKTAQAVTLDWAALTEPDHAARLDLVRRLLDIRAREIAPRLAGMRGGQGSGTVISHRAVAVSWELGDGSRLQLAVNFDDAAVTHAEIGKGLAGSRVLFSSIDAARQPAGDTLPACSLIVSLREAKP
ncbi:MAG: malto-oligosyltrehalose trehalohydrolase [Hyphomicrobiaceae bacterium]|nr:malto-oligosyltrehalose trehalohydrolase [Hyphomicrobiaceae bacterium]